jgi:4-hydroxy-tetrahydrodipicolinate synthase
MAQGSGFRGVLAASLTPLTAKLAIDHAALLRHCRWLLRHGCHGIALFGTTGEGPSFSAGERQEALERLIAGGIPSAALMVGTGCSALTDTVALTRHAVALGCPGVLCLPPFFFKRPSEEGLFGYFAELVQRVGDARLRLYLYHIPQLSAVGLGVPLIARLRKAYPTAIAGIKDSSGDWENTRSLLDGLPGFAVFTGWDPHLRDLLRRGGAGAISGMPNINPAGLRRLYESWAAPEGEALHDLASRLIAIVDATPPTAGLRAVLARYSGDPSWLARRPPLAPLAASEEAALLAAVAATGFRPPPFDEARPQ